jgi:nucleoside-diphosphate-sugar epimerase
LADEHRTLVTGAHGCLGAWTLKALRRLGEEPVGLRPRGLDDARLRLVLSRTTAPHHARLGRRHGRRCRRCRHSTSHAITNVVHLAAMQVPFVRAIPNAERA